MGKKTYIFIIFFVLQIVDCQCAKLIILNDLTKEYELTLENVECFESNLQLSIEQITKAGGSQKFKQLSDEQFSIRNINKPQWFRFRINDKSSLGRWVLENQDPHIDAFELYTSTDGLEYKRLDAGSTLRFSSRGYDHKNFVFDINPSRNTVSPYYYIRVQSSIKNPLLFKIRSSKFFVKYSLQEYYMLGFFYGILVIMLIYNAFIYFSMREKVYLIYIAYVSCAILLFLSEDGLGYQYFWPNNPKVNVFLRDYKDVLFLLSFSMYGITFLKLRNEQPRLYIYFIISIACYLVFVTGVNYLIESDSLKILLRTSVFLMPFALLYLASVRSYKMGYSPARYFIIGLSFVIIGLGFMLFRENGVSYFNNLLTIYSLNIGVVIEIVVLSMGLAERLRLLKDDKEVALRRLVYELEEKEKLKDKVNKELEDQVWQRTKDLTDSKQEIEAVNAQLIKQQEEINLMNLKLDVANTKLKKEVKSIATQLTSGRTVTYEEFLDVYPTKESCYILLADLKWIDEFECKKCRHNSYCNGRSFRSRRCTKCTFDESVTNFTLFKSIKIPLEKAFYMTYLVFKSNSPVSATEVSSKIDLRLSTCFHFIKKVEAQLKGAENAKIRMNDWSDLVVISKSKELVH